MPHLLKLRFDFENPYILPPAVFYILSLNKINYNLFFDILLMFLIQNNANPLTFDTKIDIIAKKGGDEYDIKKHHRDKNRKNDHVLF